MPQPKNKKNKINDPKYSLFIIIKLEYYMKFMA